jgi:flavin reductase (DIM6/NTAB) family NADH-FMN oxidoreductase RutF
MVIDPKTSPARDIYFLMISAIVPRPIAFVSTRSAAGVTNLAPFSYFNGVTSKPPLVSISIGQRRWEGKLVKKDTLRNIEETGEFVVNAATEPLLERLNQTSAEYPPNVSEIEAAGLTPLPSDIVAPPRIKESPIHLECRLERIIWLGDEPQNGLVIGEVVRFHIDEAVWDPENRTIDPERLKPVSRLGGTLYGALGGITSLPRPDWGGKERK